MRKLIFYTIGIIIIATSCSFQTDDEIRNDGYADLVGGHHLYYGDFGYIDNPSDTLDEKIKKIVVDIMLKNLYYEEIKELILANPKEIWKRGYADCDGYAIILQDILYTELGIRSKMSLYYYISLAEEGEENNTSEYMEKTIINGGRINHAVISIGDKYYEPQTGDQIYPASVGYEYELEFIFSGSFAPNILDY